MNTPWTAAGPEAGDSIERPLAHASRSPALLLLLSTLVLVAFYYLGRADLIGSSSAGRGWFVQSGTPLPAAHHYLASAVLLGIVPVLAARWLCGFRLAELGLGLGRWRTGVALLVVGIPLALLAGKIGSVSPPMRAVYPLYPAASDSLPGFASYALLQFLYYGSWEVLFRGVLLFGLKERLGPGMANVLQTALSVTAHFGRPLTETFSAVPAGLVFGWLDLRMGSVWSVAIIHWLVGASLDWFVLAS